MDNNRISQLTAKEIAEKDFKSAMRGYNIVEVDEFLDIIIKDYEAFNREIMRLRQENQRLKSEMGTQKTEPRRPLAPQGQTNYDILKRLSNLEKHVFGSRLSE
ncbi:DivIVA domain-containing protein [Scopulibacillus daqui]|uniref:DivIVA domain-containing protein n=1 Tax=Scopulibacillus daqui TaxID=1469162 RepID=A0ABS2Q024_9BACL|nr:cell division regulator GpsB [Scopulibacillus daqui]MBM7645566.1 DivIVA domain-containing protein [Scopulibacillus daqui]